MPDYEILAVDELNQHVTVRWTDVAGTQHTELIAGLFNVESEVSNPAYDPNDPLHQHMTVLELRTTPETIHAGIQRLIDGRNETLRASATDDRPILMHKEPLDGLVTKR